MSRKRRRKKIKMSRKNAEILLAAVIIARSTSYMFSKMVMETMGPFNLMGVRFTIAFAILAVIFHRKLLALNKKTLQYGMIIGGIYFLTMTAELFGLKLTDTSTTSFLENTAIVLVPLIEAVICRKSPAAKALFSAALTLTGVGFLAFRDGSISLKPGVILCLLAAMLYAVGIILTDRLARKEDPLTIGILQVGFMGAFSVIASFIFETPRLPDSTMEWDSIIMLAVVCSCFGFTLQPVAQKYTTSERTGMFCALNPLTAATLGTLLLNESLGVQGIAGAALVLGGILISSLKLSSKVEKVPAV